MKKRNLIEKKLRIWWALKDKPKKYHVKKLHQILSSNNIFPRTVIIENNIFNENGIISIYITIQDSANRVSNAHMKSNTWTIVKFRELKLKLMSWFIYVDLNMKTKSNFLNDKLVTPA